MENDCGFHFGVLKETFSIVIACAHLIILMKGNPWEEICLILTGPIVHHRYTGVVHLSFKIYDKRDLYFSQASLLTLKPNLIVQV